MKSHCSQDQLLDPLFCVGQAVHQLFQFCTSLWAMFKAVRDPGFGKPKFLALHGDLLTCSRNLLHGSNCVGEWSIEAQVVQQLVVGFGALGTLDLTGPQTSHGFVAFLCIFTPNNPLEFPETSMNTEQLPSHAWLLLFFQRQELFFEKCPWEGWIGVLFLSANLHVHVLCMPASQSDLL